MGFIEITEGLPEEFPMKVGEFDIKIKINLKKVEQLWEMEKQIKFDVSSQSYTPKEQIKTRSISD